MLLFTVISIFNIAIWSSSACLLENDNTSELNIKCEEGEMRGMFLLTKEGRQIRAFMSIPYAEAPIGSLRFQPPVPHRKWEGVLNASRIHDLCIQRNIYTRSDVIEGVEDCIYLNIYTPKKTDIKEPLPVMMFIHGGGYLSGGGNINWYGPDKLLDRNVILVVPNYRLGPLGFLSTRDDIFPGNNGLKDQSLALSWIYKNIENFGGNPKLITVFGQSAGGGATHLHMMSPMSRNMVARGISHSGTALSPWNIAPKGEAKTNAYKLATLLKCPITSSQEMLECLLKIEARKFIELDRQWMEWDYDPMIPFKPVVEHNHDGAFLKEHPTDIIKSGTMPNIPWMVGVTASDGAIRAAGILANEQKTKDINDEFGRLVPISLLYEKNIDDVKAVTREIRKLYFDENVEIGRSTQQGLVDMYTDGWFFNGTDFSIKLHRTTVKNDVYLYKFAHRGASSNTEIYGDPNYDYGVCHGDELLYLFPLEKLFSKKEPLEADNKMEKYITTLWATFAKYGKPTLENETSSNVQWTKVLSDRLEYFHLEIPEKSLMGIDMFSERTRVWRTLDKNSRF